MYWIYLDRRTAIEDRQVDLETQTFNLFPERWAQLYEDKTLSALVTGGDDEGFEAPVTDIDALDQWYEQMVTQGGTHSMRAGSSEEWGDWQ